MPILRRSPRAILRIRAKNPLISDQVAINYRKADITERQKAMLDFALKVSRSAETVGEADFDVLKSHGFDEEGIWNIAVIAGFFALSNRMANVTAMRPNAEFYTDDRNVFRTGRSADDQIDLELTARSVSLLSGSRRRLGHKIRRPRRGKG